MIIVTRDDFSADEIVDKIKQRYTGGVVTFRGVVRGESKGKEIERMTIEVYEEMAQKQLETIREEALDKFDVQEVAVIHRYGNFNVGDNIVLIGVAAGHRERSNKNDRHLRKRYCSKKCHSHRQHRSKERNNSSNQER